MKRCDTCGDWLVYQEHDCGPVLERREVHAEWAREYLAERERQGQKDQIRWRWYAALAGISVLLIAGTAIVNISGGDEGGAGVGEVSRSVVTALSQTSPASTVESGSAVESGSTVDSDLRMRGMTRDLLDELNAQAAKNGYAISRGALLALPDPECTAGFAGDVVRHR